MASGPGAVGTILRMFMSKDGINKSKLFFTHRAGDHEEAFNVANISMTSESDKVWLIGLDQNEKSAAMWLLNELKEMQAVTSHSNNIDLAFYEKMQKKLSSDTVGAAKASSAASAAALTEKNYLNEFIEMREFFVNIFISGLEKYSSQRASESTKHIVKQELSEPLFSMYNNIKGFFHKKNVAKR